MNRNKGFTLIELLAVIVILAIIALIATPIVLGIINDAKASANKQSASFIINAVEQSYNMAFALNGGITPTLSQVRERFNMENAEWGTDKDNNPVITANGGDVVCHVETVENRFLVNCDEFGISSMKM